MREVEKKARVLDLDFDDVLQYLLKHYGESEHVFAEDIYYSMPGAKRECQTCFRIRKNYSGETLKLVGIVVNTKCKKMMLDNLENNIEIEFELPDQIAERNFVEMMIGFGAKYWYTKKKGKYVFKYNKDVEYHIELCTLPIGGRDEHFLEIEGVFDSENLSAVAEEAIVSVINSFIDNLFVKLGLEKNVEPRPYRVLLGVSNTGGQ